MTSCLISVALIFTPAPLTAPKEAPTPWPHIQIPALVAAAPPPTTTLSESEPIQLIALPSVETSTAASVEPVPPEPPPRLTPAELVDELFGWPGRQLVQCESSWNRWAVGRYGERGLFQIHPVHRARIAAMGYSWDDMFEVEPNIRVAVEVRRVQGLRAWTCWRG